MARLIAPGHSAPPRPEKDSAPDSRLEILTSLRFFVALAIVLHHAGLSVLLANIHPAGKLILGSMAGLQFFYLLSGFVLGYSYLDRFPGAGRFFKARFIRVYPLYLLALLVSFPSLLMYFVRGQIEQGGLALVTAPLLLQAWFPPATLIWNGPGWSLSVEAFLYIVFPLALPHLPVTRARLVAWLFALWALSLAVPIAYCVWNPDHVSNMSASAIYALSPLQTNGWLATVLHNPVLHVPTFLGGAVLSRLFKLTRRHAASVSRVAFWPVMAFTAVVLYCAGAAPYPLLHNGLLLPLFYFLIWMASAPGPVTHKVLGSRPLVVLGDATYAIYILQFPIFEAFKLIYGQLTGVRLTHECTTLTSLAIYTLIVCALSVWVAARLEPALRQRFASLWLPTVRRTGYLPQANAF